MHYKTGHRAAMILLFGGLGLCLIAAMMDARWLEITGVCVALAGLLADALVYRCPCCHKSLAGHGRAPHNCPNCGAPLDDNKE